MAWNNGFGTNLSAIIFALGNCGLNTGVATLFKGSFLQNAPNANPNGDTLYAWVECTVTF